MSTYSVLGFVLEILVEQEMETNEARPLSSGNTHSLTRQNEFNSIINNVKISAAEQSKS